MFDILIVGGGFAGVWSAMAAARLAQQEGKDLTIGLVAPGDDLVIRPRLYQTDPGAMRVPLERVLRPIGVHRLAAVATAIDPVGKEVTITGNDGRTRALRYQRLILATGSALRRPGLPGAQYLHDIDTLSGAVALDTHLRTLPSGQAGPGQFSAVVVGAGFTGLEVATELAGRLRAQAGTAAEEVRVILVEKGAVPAPDLGDAPRPTITAALHELGIETRVNASLTEVHPEHVRLTDGTELPARTVVWTAGMIASPLTGYLPGRHDQLGRLLVDQHLRVPECPDIFAAGDTAAADAGNDRFTLQSCQHAIPLGKHAGHNAAADLLHQPAIAFTAEPYATCLDLGAAGAVLTMGWERTVKVTGKQAKEIKRAINEQRIYPPVDDADAILGAADPAYTWTTPAA
ncbi:NAD(P)/FAD-dependent oxidoreductase [Streptomyces sp. Tue6028]|uniref:NAD(P)/FAD-dependent oxidoreductase n=1 Tax=Streptomyces sp. Tue6028 TaxID=2036037 RepID=UPI003D762982